MAFRKVLIVDDSKLARVTLKKKLESYGLVVDLVDSARQAYASLPQIQPDIIFMDHLMPDIDGFEATQHIRQMQGFDSVPIVMCTGKEQDGYLEEALAIGANYILSKPPVDEALEAIVASGNMTNDVVSDVASETDSADALSENTVAASTFVEIEEVGLPVMEEAGVADFIVESTAQLAETSAIETASPLPMATLLGITEEDVERICSDLIADALADLPAPALPLAEFPPVDMDVILSTVNAAVTHQLAVSASLLKTNIQNELETLVGNKITQMLDQEIQGILDLRLNVMLGEKFAQTHNKLESFEQRLNEKKSAQHDTMDDTSLILQQPGNMGSRVDQLHRLEQVNEEQIRLRVRLQLLQKLVIAAAGVGVAAIALVFIV